MAVLRFSSAHRRHQGEGGHTRKLSGVFASFLDAFRCRIDSSSSSNTDPQKSKGGARLKLRQILHRATSQEVCAPPKQDAGNVAVTVEAPSPQPDPGVPNKAGEESERKQRSMGMRWLVEGMGSGRTEDERLKAATEVRRVSRDSAENRLVLGALGVIPLLVALLDSTSSSNQPLLALLNLGIGNSRNKQLIVEAGAVPILVRILSDALSSRELIGSATAALLSLSALDSNKPVVGQSGAVEQLLRVVVHERDWSSSIARDAIRVMYNLSISSANVGRMVADGVPGMLLSLVDTHTDALLADRILATLGNLAEFSDEARKFVISSGGIAKLLSALTLYTTTLEMSSSSSSAFSSSLSEEEALSSSSHTQLPPGGGGGREQFSRCQERVLYLLMLLTHHSWPARQAAISAGAVTPLLEVALLGSPIAQRRAGRILDCLREERFQRTVARPMSAPLPHDSSSVIREPPTKPALCDERRAVNWMVRQSLERNMEKMVRRARLPSQDLDVTSRMTISSRLNRSFGSSSSSKVLLVAI